MARKWPSNIIRAKGICYFKGEEDTCYLFEQAGKQVGLQNAGQWYATMPKEELEEALKLMVKRVLQMKDDIGLLMLERSATKGLHIVFKRIGWLNQEENL